MGGTVGFSVNRNPERSERRATVNILLRFSQKFHSETQKMFPKNIQRVSYLTQIQGKKAVCKAKLWNMGLPGETEMPLD